MQAALQRMMVGSRLHILSEHHESVCGNLVARLYLNNDNAGGSMMRNEKIRASDDRTLLEDEKAHKGTAPVPCLGLGSELMQSRIG